MPLASSEPSPVLYQERLYLGIGWWIGALAMAFILGVELLPLFHISAWVTIGVPMALAAIGVGAGCLRVVRVTAEGISAGPISLAAANISSVEELDQRNTRRYAGVAGDPAAQVCVRPWIKTSVRIVCVHDDPPFALVSSRHPERLAAALISVAADAAEHE